MLLHHCSSNFTVSARASKETASKSFNFKIHDFFEFQFIQNVEEKMELGFLGTSSAMPTNEKNVSGLVIRPFIQKKELILIDCGEGTQHNFLKTSDWKGYEDYKNKSSFSLSNVRLILITHLHGDHLFGLPGLLCTLGGQINSKKDTKITIVGPKGLKVFLETVFKVTESFLNFKLEILELLPKNETGEGITLSKKGLYEIPEFFDISIKAYLVSHRVMTVGYILEKKPYKGGFLPEKLYLDYKIHFGILSDEFKEKHNIKEKFNFRSFFNENKYNLPKNFMKMIKIGDVKYRKENGEEGIILSSDVLDKPKKGQCVAVIGDCNESDPEKVLEKNYKGKIDFIVHECTLSDDMKDYAISKGHSTPVMVGEFLKKIQPKFCVLTHFSTRFSVDPENESNIFILREETKKHFKEVEVAKDFLYFQIK